MVDVKLSKSFSVVDGNLSIPATVTSDDVFSDGGSVITQRQIVVPFDYPLNLDEVIKSLIETYPKVDTFSWADANYVLSSGMAKGVSI